MPEASTQGGQFRCVRERPFTEDRTGPSGPGPFTIMPTAPALVRCLTLLAMFNESCIFWTARMDVVSDDFFPSWSKVALGGSMRSRSKWPVATSSELRHRIICRGGHLLPGASPSQVADGHAERREIK